MKEPINKRAIGVGIFIIVGIAFLVGGVLTIGNLHSTFQRKINISTVFGDVNGLQSGNNIWFSGVKIGTVKKIEFYGKSQVKVIMNINMESKQFIRKNAMVKIGSDGLIGNKIIEIYDGTSAAPEIEEGDTLMNEIALTTEEIMSTLQQNNINILKFTDKLASGQGTIGKLFNNDSIYNNLARTSSSLQAASLQVQSIVLELNNFTKKLNKKGALANELISDTTIFKSLKQSISQLSNIADTTAHMISKLDKASSNEKSSLGVLLYSQEAGADLKATISSLRSSSAKLDQDLEAIQHSFLLRKFFKKKEALKK